RLDEAPAVVADRFSWFAALLPPVYGLVHRLWLPTAGWLILAIAIGASGLVIGEEAALWLYILFAVLIGFEAPALRRRALRRQGYVYRTELVAPADDLAQVEWVRRRGTA